MRKASAGLVAAKTLVHALALTPLAILAWQFHDVWRNGSDALGADPVAEIEHRTGLWALRLLMVALAITSTQGWMRRLGRRWGQLHKLVYAIGVLAVLHFWWLVKSDIREPLLYAGILAALLGWRLWKSLSRRRTAAAR